MKFLLLAAALSTAPIAPAPAHDYSEEELHVVAHIRAAIIACTKAKMAPRPWLSQAKAVSAYWSDLDENQEATVTDYLISELEDAEDYEFLCRRDRPLIKLLYDRGKHR